MTTLLLDFGGVIAEGAAPRPPEARSDLILRLYNLTEGALTPGDISRSLVTGEAAVSAWREQDPFEELSHEDFWLRFFCADWPLHAREAVRGQASRLAHAWAYNPGWMLRPGIPEAVLAAVDAGMPRAVVSNTICGAAHRDFLKRVGLAEYLPVQIYSDEAGVRKPNPEMIWRAARELGVPPEECWFVGDSYQRDVACARRANAGKAVLFHSRRTAGEDPAAHPAPDAEVTDGHQLKELILAG